MLHLHKLAKTGWHALERLQTYVRGHRGSLPMYNLKHSCPSDSFLLIVLFRISWPSVQSWYAFTAGYHISPIESFKYCGLVEYAGTRSLQNTYHPFKSLCYANTNKAMENFFSPLLYLYVFVYGVQSKKWIKSSLLWNISPLSKHLVFISGNGQDKHGI